MGKRLVGVIGALALSAGVASCSYSGACPAIGWNNVINVTLEGQTQKVDVVQLCADDVCWVPVETQLQSDEPVHLETLTPTELQAYTPTPSTTELPYLASQVDGSWEISTGMAAPERVTVRALSANGDVIAERDVTLNWVRLGGVELGGLFGLVVEPQKRADRLHRRPPYGCATGGPPR